MVEAWTPVEGSNEVPRFTVLAENWDAVRLFEASDTQWRVAGMSGIPIGLDLAGVRVAGEAIGVSLAGETFAKLKAIERYALEALAERRERR